MAAKPREMEIEAGFPASAAQERMWLHQQRYPESRAYVVPVALWLKGELRAPALERALSGLVERHDQLRARFTLAGGELIQRIVPAAAQPFVLGRARVDPSGVAGWLRDEMLRGFDLAEGPLCRMTLLDLGADEHMLIFCIHHIVTDGWTSGLLFRDLDKLYRCACADEIPQSEGLPRSYEEAVVAERDWIASPAFAGTLESSAKLMESSPPRLELPFGEGREQIEAAGTIRVRLADDLVAAVQKRARSAGVTPFMVYAAAYAALLSRYSGQSDVIFGVPSAGHGRSDFADTVGLFVNTMPLRVDLHDNYLWSDALAKVREAALQALTHSKVPIDRLLARLGRGPLQAILGVQLQALPQLHLPGVESAWCYADNVHTKADLILKIDQAEAWSAERGGPERGWFATLEYRDGQQSAASAARMVEHLQQILAAIADSPDSRAGDLDLVTPAERSLRGGCLRLEKTCAPIDPVAAMERMATERPEAVAIRSEGTIVTYAGFAARVHAIHAALIEAGVRPDDFVGICLNRTPDLVAALFAILRCGAAYVPLDPQYPTQRLAFILEDAACAVVIVEPDTERALPGYHGRTLYLHDIGEAGVEPPTAAAPDERVAYLIYTSGSTGRPKGVAIPHRSFRAFIGWSCRFFDADDLRLTAASTSICFDMSVFELFTPLSVGGTIRLVDNALALTRPTEEPITLIDTVPSAMAEILRAGTLPATIRVINLGGEALQRNLVDQAHAQSPHVRVFNFYGPSEDTTFSTWSEVPRGSPEDPTIGIPLDGANGYVLDKRLVPVPVGVDGELYLAGVGTAQGYHARAGLTAERFIPDPFSPRPGARMYATGDTVRLSETGELLYRGRSDKQVKLRGYRVEIGEIESAARHVPGVTQVEVVCREVAGSRRLVCYWTGSADAERLCAELSSKLPDFMIPDLWMRLPAFPLNANGKIDRAELPEPVPTPSAAVAPATPTETRLAAIFSELTQAEAVGADTDFFAAGGHSLLAMRLGAAVRDSFGISLTLPEIFGLRSVRAIAERIDGGQGAQAGLPPLRALDQEQPVPLAFDQERMWLIERLRPGSAMLNIAVAFRCVGDLDRDSLRRALQSLTDRHAALRLRIDADPAGGVSQRAVAGQPACLEERVSPNSAATAELLRQAAAAFDLAAEAPARWLLVEEPALSGATAQNVLLLVIHHAVADAWSLRILLDDLAELYAAERAGHVSQLAPCMSALDYAAWQREELGGRAAMDGIAYWQQQLAELPERLQLPFDHPAAEAVSFKAARFSRRLPADAVERLVSIADEAGATPFMALIAAYQLLLSRLSGQDDIVVGAPIANRDLPGTGKLVGCLLNTLALRADFTSTPTFLELLAQTQQRCLEAFAQQHVPFELVIRALSVPRNAEHSPVFQAMFVLDTTGSDLALPDLVCTPLAVEPQATQFDLTLKVARDGTDWCATWYYRADLFEAESAACIADCFETLLRAIVEQPGRSVRRLPLSAAGGPSILSSDPLDGSRRPETLAALFDAQASATPQAAALRDGEGVLSYAQLQRASDRLAARLVGAGVEVEDRVAIVLPRGRHAVIALLAVAKAGAAFLCLDPSLPAERKAWIARDAGIRIQLTSPAAADGLVPDIASLRVDEAAAGPEPAPFGLPRVSADHLAYVIYTSGSTGRPKGVLLSNRGLAQLQALHRERFGAGPGDQVLQYSPCSFDAFVWEHVMALLTGACLHLADPERLQPGPPLAATIHERGITHLTMPPSNAAMLGALPPTVKQLILAGEPCPPEAVMRWAGTTTLWNAYGPTEATVCATIKGCKGVEPGKAPSIGTPFADAQAFVLDEGMNPVPPLVPGELYLGGPGLARGYLGQAALTAASFVPHPFPSVSGERLYRTGDLARITLAGEVEFLGRRDGQVKLRGIRVELGEIENALASLDPGIAGAAALVAGTREDRHLVAFVAGRPELDVAALRERLSAHLPAYMIPAWVERVDAFPFTANGKLDRAALASRAAGRHRHTGHRTPPRGALEQEVASIWGQLLTDVEIGRDDSFFSIGGTSLTLTRLHALLEARFAGRLRIVDLFRLNTVAAIASALESDDRAVKAAPGPAVKLSIHL